MVYLRLNYFVNLSTEMFDRKEMIEE